VIRTWISIELLRQNSNIPGGIARNLRAAIHQTVTRQGTMFKYKRPLLLGMAVLMAVIIAACGSEDASPVAAPTTAPSTNATATPAGSGHIDETAIPAATIVPVEPTATQVVVVPNATVPPAPTATEAPVGGTDSVTLTPSQDNTLYESDGGSLSSGAGASLFVGTTNSGSGRRALIQFDIASAVPDGATIKSIALTMTVTKTVAGSSDVALHPLSIAWGEGGSSGIGRGGGGGSASEAGDAAWTHAVMGGEAWSSPGGDFAAGSSASASIASSGAYTWTSTEQLVADVQLWLDSPDQNFGWIIIGNEDSTKTAKRFASRESSSGNTRPQLVIEFTS